VESLKDEAQSEASAFINEIMEEARQTANKAWSRTPAFHAGNRGSNPLGDATFTRVKGRQRPFVSNILSQAGPGNHKGLS
ncbi:MAG: hypothetical protein R6W95_04695, partial [Desulfosarcina sp.]